MSIPVATVSNTGISCPTYAEVLDAVQALYRSIYGSDIYIDPDSQDGQLIAAFAAAIDDCNKMSVAVFRSFSPSYAQGAGLSSVVKINGIRRLESSHSTATGTLVGVAGTIVTEGVVKDVDGNLWDLPATVTIPISGEITVTVTAQEPGVIVAPAGSIDSINTPTFGWQSFVSVTDAIPGDPVEDDAELRARQAVSTALPAQDVIEALIGTLANLPGVQRLKVYENDTGTTDAHGIPEHSICCVVQGGDTTDIAETIHSKKTPGTGTYGDTTIVVTDQYGLETSISFEVLDLIDCSATIVLQPLTGYLSTTGELIQEVVAAYYNSLQIGEGSYMSRLWNPANLSGDVATETSGMSQSDLDALSSTYRILSLSQSRTDNPVATLVASGPYAAGETTVSLDSVAGFYIGQEVAITLDDASLHTVRITDVTDPDISFLPAIPAGRSVLDDAEVFFVSDLMMAFNEAAFSEAANITITVV